MPVAQVVRRTLILSVALLATASVAHAGGSKCRTLQCESDPAALARPSKTTQPSPAPSGTRASAASHDPDQPAAPERLRATTPFRVLTARPTLRGKVPAKHLPATPSLSTLLRLSTGSGDEVS